MSFNKACSGSEIKGLRLSIRGGFSLPGGGDAVYFVAGRSSYPLAGCSPAEPTFVSLDSHNVKTDPCVFKSIETTLKQPFIL